MLEIFILKNKIKYGKPSHLLKPIFTSTNFKIITNKTLYEVFFFLSNGNISPFLRLGNNYKTLS